MSSVLWWDLTLHRVHTRSIQMHVAFGDAIGSIIHACLSALLCSARQIPPLGMHDELTTLQATPFVASDFIYLATVVWGEI